MFEWFDKIYCINLDKRADRWQKSLEEFTKVGIQVERFKAYENDNRVLAFNKSQYYCIQKALEDGCERFLILEDDVEFRNWHHLDSAINELPGNWSLLQLGCNLLGVDTFKFQHPLPYSKHLRVLVDAWQTHAVGYTRAMGQL
jgi:hypothetical protein